MRFWARIESLALCSAENSLPRSTALCLAMDSCEGCVSPELSNGPMKAHFAPARSFIDVGGSPRANIHAAADVAHARCPVDDSIHATDPLQVFSCRNHCVKKKAPVACVAYDGRRLDSPGRIAPATQGRTRRTIAHFDRIRKNFPLACSMKKP